MYRAGDKVLYPMHGAGVIQQVKSCEILGEVKDYYLLHVPCGDMEVMIPVEACDDIGVRPRDTRGNRRSDFCSWPGFHRIKWELEQTVQGEH